MNHGRDSLGRRSRMRATSTSKRIRLTERDMAWLRALHTHGPLPSSYLLEFAGSMARSRKRAKERLGDLFHEKNTLHGAPYLLRPSQQFQTIDSRYNQLVYDVAPAGSEALKRSGNWSDASGPNGGPWWHKFMVSCVTASIELGCRSRHDLNFISQSSILERAGVSLSCPVRYSDPASGKTVQRDIRPDALFGLEYVTQSGNRYRFFAVEADRSTEPLTSSSSARKSWLKTVLQYEQLVAGQAYQSRFSLTAPLMVLNVCSSQNRAERISEIVMQTCPRMAPAMLFSDALELERGRKISGPMRELLETPWMARDGNTARIDLP